MRRSGSIFFCVQAKQEHANKSSLTIYIYCCSDGGLGGRPLGWLHGRARGPGCLLGPSGGLGPGFGRFGGRGCGAGWRCLGGLLWRFVGHPGHHNGRRASVHRTSPYRDAAVALRVKTSAFSSCVDRQFVHIMHCHSWESPSPSSMIRTSPHYRNPGARFVSYDPGFTTLASVLRNTVSPMIP